MTQPRQAFGVTISELCGTVFMLIRSRRRSDSFNSAGRKLTGDELFRVCRDIFIKALPISLGAAASNLLSLADMLTISNCIDLSANIFDGYWSENAVLSQIRDNCSGVGNFMYGCYAGIIMSVYMLAAAASGVVARCALPRLAYAAESGKTEDTAHEMKLLIKGTSVITAPLTVFMAVLSEPILRVLYPSRTLEVSVSAVPLAVLSAGGLAAALLGAVCVVFHAYGDFGFPIKVTLAGGAMKLVFNVLFITAPFLNISGAAISAVLSNVLCLIWAVTAVRKRFGIRTGCIRYTIPSVFAAISGGVGVYLFYRGFSGHFGTLVSMVMALLPGAVIYALVLYIYDSADCAAVIRSLRRRRA